MPLEEHAAPDLRFDAPVDARQGPRCLEHEIAGVHHAMRMAIRLRVPVLIRAGGVVALPLRGLPFAHQPEPQRQQHQARAEQAQRARQPFAQQPAQLVAGDRRRAVRRTHGARSARRA